jgi:nucleoside-diphosphate-sugar epimerase
VIEENYPFSCSDFRISGLYFAQYERVKLRSTMKIFITGGAGYIGARMIPILLDDGHDITVYDTCYFGADFLPLHDPNFHLVVGDIRNTILLEESCREHEIFLNLACISNDASFELNEELSTSVNMDAFLPMVRAAKKSGIRRFIYASSSSVYGVSDSPEVTEEHELVPLTLYNKYKGMCEPLLLSEGNENFEVVVFRPATVCGYSPRQRLDLSVNILTNLAYNSGEMTVFGGDQRRPNIHILDYIDVVRLLLVAPKQSIHKQVFNVGNENLTINEIAYLVKTIVEGEIPSKREVRILRTESIDNRSYHINSDKIFKVLGFKAKRTVEEAVLELCQAFKAGKIPNSLEDDQYFNVKTLRKLGIK